ncbi:MAG: NADH-quinone oxidoreductase subunit D [Candidatus Micrarchaeota archaeon]|nr:NADH-quinone oxidoreductase subunit D [Candidatus Micrarchaeota archaeon]
MAETKINIGPVHPSTHGVLRLVVTLDGDTVKHVEPHIGFLHRGVEKLVETRMYMQSPSYMEKLDYVAPLSYDELYVATVEAALGIEVKERAQYVRLVQLELQRLASHLFWLGTLLNDIGQLFSMFMWAFKDRDIVLRLMEEATGGRMFYVNMRLGGLNRDFAPGFEGHAGKVLEYLEHRLDEYEDFLESNPIFLERLKGIGVMDKKAAIGMGVTGHMLRGSGVEYDVRKNYPYYAYEKLGFRIQTHNDGDCFARYKVRMNEMKESIRLIREALLAMPQGDAIGMPIRLIGPPPKNREAIVKRELPRGEGIMYMVAEGQRPYRLSIRAPSFINTAAIQSLPVGHRLQDLFTILATIDTVLADVDR